MSESKQHVGHPWRVAGGEQGTWERSAAGMEGSHAAAREGLLETVLTFRPCRQPGAACPRRRKGPVRGP